MTANIWTLYVFLKLDICCHLLSSWHFHMYIRKVEVLQILFLIDISLDHVDLQKMFNSWKYYKSLYIVTVILYFTLSNSIIYTFGKKTTIGFCSTRKVYHNVSLPNCEPRRIVDFVCDGDCASYRTSNKIPCSYCETETCIYNVPLKCTDGEPRFVALERFNACICKLGTCWTNKTSIPPVKDTNEKSDLTQKKRLTKCKSWV